MVEAMTRWMLAATAFVGLGGIASAGMAQTTGAAQLTAAQSAEYGAYVADAEGRALYMFTADQQGTGDQAATSNCYDACAQAWPPLLTEGDPVAGPQVDETLLGTLERQDGTTQVTYGGWPLYYYVQDQGPGQTTGQDVQGFGGEWYLVSPQGERIEEGG